MAPSIHFASLYRWLVATQHWHFPRKFAAPLLDIGADDGRFLLQIEAPLKVGMDLVSRPRGLTYPWIQADGCRLPFPAQSFGHLLAFDVIEHVEKDALLLQEAVRVVRPGGTIWLSTPAHQFYMFPGEIVQRRFERSIGHVRRGYSAKMLQERLPAGIKVDITWWNEPAFRAGYLALYLLKRLSAPLPNRLIPALVRYDAGRPAGEAGHLFARITVSGK